MRGWQLVVLVLICMGAAVVADRALRAKPPTCDQLITIDSPDSAPVSNLS